MNNITILIGSIVTGLIIYHKCFNGEDMALFVLSLFVLVPAFITSVVGIIKDENYFC